MHVVYSLTPSALIQLELAFEFGLFPEFYLGTKVRQSWNMAVYLIVTALPQDHRAEDRSSAIWFLS